MVSTRLSRISTPVPRRSMPSVAALRAPDGARACTSTTAERMSSGFSCAATGRAANSKARRKRRTALGKKLAEGFDALAVDAEIAPAQARGRAHMDHAVRAQE